MKSMELSHDEINYLAQVGTNLQYNANNFTASAVQLASDLLANLRSGSIDLKNETLRIVGDATRTSNFSEAFATQTLERFQYLPTSKRHGLAALWIAMMIVSGIVVALRLYSRLRYHSGMKLVDWVLLFAWLIAAAENCEDVYLVLRHNFDSHCWNISLHDINMHWKIAPVDQMLGVTCQFLFKLALLLFYYEIYQSRWFRLATYVMGGVITTYMVVNYIYFAVHCTPLDKWNYPPDQIHCMKHNLSVFYFLTALNIAIDSIIIGLPIIPIFKLNLSTSKKVVVIVLIAIGGLVCIASIVRLTKLEEYVDSSDVTVRALDASTWQLLEVHLGIICSSVPSMRKLVQATYEHYKNVQEERRTGVRQYSSTGSIVEILRRVPTGGWQPRNMSTSTASPRPSRAMSGTSQRNIPDPDFSNYQLRTANHSQGALEQDYGLEHQCSSVNMV